MIRTGGRERAGKAFGQRRATAGPRGRASQSASAGCSGGDEGSRLDVEGGTGLRCEADATGGADRLRQLAIELLARREHSTTELRRKLRASAAASGLDGEAVNDLIASLADRGLQSDERFVEASVRSRIRKGQGPLRIRAELARHDLDEALLDQQLLYSDAYWLERAREVVRQRRVGLPLSDPDRGRLARMLAQRGFPGDTIYRVLDELRH